MLRNRLGLLVALSVLVALAGFAILVDSLFVELQVQQFEAAAQREADRASDLVAASEVGARLIEADDGGPVLQFVARDGTVVLPAGSPTPLPDRETAGRATGVDGRAWVVASAPWRLPSGTVVGTIRVGKDLAGLDEGRAALLRAILLGGTAIAVVATLLALWALDRSLAPLGRLVRDAEAIDPSHPELLVDLAAQDRRDEVGTLARTLSDALAAIRARQQAERDALAEVAHELAAPLSVVAGRLRGVEARDPSPEIRAAREAADELLHTSRDLLAVARGELERVLEMEVVDLAELVRGVAAETPFVQVNAPTPAEVLGSPERLRQAVRNLLRNALAAGGLPDAVVAVVRTVDGTVEVEVRDRGPGLPPGEEATVFERHRSRRAGGTGLGLSVARTIADAHDGELTARNRDGGGAAFALRVPSLDARLDDEDDGAEALLQDG